MSESKKEYPIDWNLKCNLQYDMKASFYTLILMIADENLCYESFEKLIDEFFPQHLNQCKELYIHIQEEGKIYFPSYTKDIAETKSLEIKNYARGRKIGIKALLNREKTMIL